MAPPENESLPPEESRLGAPPADDMAEFDRELAALPMPPDRRLDLDVEDEDE